MRELELAVVVNDKENQTSTASSGQKNIIWTELINELESNEAIWSCNHT